MYNQNVADGWILSEILIFLVYNNNKVHLLRRVLKYISPDKL